MQFISTTEATQNFETVIDRAKQEPVIIRERDREVAVVLSIEDYQRITRSNIQEFQQFREKIGLQAQKRGLTEELLNELLNENE